ncbi:MAG: MBL fold metallo-hydrolase, partial [Chloroflexota bacterium]
MPAGRRQRVVGQDRQRRQDAGAQGREAEITSSRLGPETAEDDRGQRSAGEARENGPVDVGEVLGDPFGGHRPSVRWPRRYPMRRTGETAITWFGHACIEIVSPGGKTVLVDPWLGNPRSPRPPEAVDRCDVMLVTHGHADHLGNALQIGSRTRPAWPAIHELSLWLARNYAGKDEVIGMNKG